MELHNIHRVNTFTGQGLNLEEFSGLEVSMLHRKLNENLPGRMLFWGKIYGSTQDYLIVYHHNTLEEFPEKKFYFCTAGDYVLRAMPHLKEEYIEQAKTIETPFLGDPSFFAYNGEEEDEEPVDEEDENAPPRERFCEMHRLAYVVQKIDHDCAIVPRGSMCIDASKRVIENINFQGISYESSKFPRTYLHMRIPENLRGLALLKKPGIARNDDFLDCIDKDTPSEMWNIIHDSSNQNVCVRNFYWDGFHFISALHTSFYGYCYFGSGVPNYDIVFSL